MKELTKEEQYALHECYKLLLRQKVDIPTTVKSNNKDSLEDSSDATSEPGKSLHSASQESTLVDTTLEEV